MKQRRTRQMTATLDVVESSYDHPTAEDVLRRVRDRMPTVSLGTVYRNLEKLRSLGQVRLVRLADGVARYDGTVADHDHFICESCGTVVDLDQTARSPDFEHLEKKGFFVRSLSTTLRGVCPTCRGCGRRDDA